MLSRDSLRNTSNSTDTRNIKIRNKVFLPNQRDLHFLVRPYCSRQCAQKNLCIFNRILVYRNIGIPFMNLHVHNTQ